MKKNDQRAAVFLAAWLCFFPVSLQAADENENQGMNADGYSWQEQQEILEEACENNPDLLQGGTAQTQNNPEMENKEDKHRKTEDRLNGIDISNWQKTINLDAVDEKTDFIICKASGGISYKDPYFEPFAAKIKEKGQLFGFYHFAHDGASKASPKEEAAHFYMTVKNHLGSGIPVLDYEARDLLASGTGWAYDFVDTFYQLSGIKCMIYTSQWYALSLDWSKCAQEGYPLWVASYGKNEPQEGYHPNPGMNGAGIGSFQEYWMHQYSSRGKLKGYDGALDLNKFYGNSEEWTQLTKRDAKWAQMYRLYNPNSGEHFYTSSANERKGLIEAGWNDEDKAWKADRDGTVVFRLYNPNAGDHHYTIDSYERDHLIEEGWTDEGIGWIASTIGKPVYRLYNPNAEVGTHHFTTDLKERQVLIQEGWKDENIAWYDLET